MKSVSLMGIVAAAVLTIGSGMMHGRLTNRWGEPADMPAIATALESTPKDFGVWRCEDEFELEESVRKMLSCSGHLHRQYVNQVTGERVTLAVLLGPGGPIAVHTPEICYSSRDYKLLEPAESVSIGENNAFGVTFESTGIDAHRLRVYYGWTIGSGLQAVPDRRSLARNRYLYKVQLAALASPTKTKNDSEPDLGRQFLADFLPVLQAHLVPIETDES